METNDQGSTLLVLFKEKPPVTCGFSLQRTSNEDSASVGWRHHVYDDSSCWFVINLKTDMQKVKWQRFMQIITTFDAYGHALSDKKIMYYKYIHMYAYVAKIKWIYSSESITYH